MDDTNLVSALLGRMTLAEKIGQLNLLSAGEGPETGSAGVRNIRARLEAGQLGAIFGTKSVRSVRAWQELALEGSRHRIPLFFAEDVIHGHRTIFPLNIALACAFDPALWRDTARVAAREAAAEGINHVYAPMIDVSRDPRWGRVAECPGEDPYLAARYAEAVVEGFEGSDPRAPDTVVACLKHFLAYGAGAGGRDYDNASLGPQELIGVYAEPFRAGIAAGAGSVMASFNAVNKTPMHANRALIRGWLRGEAGFSGLIVADYTGIAEISAHGLGDRAAAAALALNAGIDMDMIGEDYLTHLPRLAAEGFHAPESGVDIPAADIVAAIDEACGRVLALKQRLGLFDDPFRYCDEARAARTALAPDHRALARRAVAETCVLLKNEDVLPLPPEARVALVGAMADDRTNLLGTWAVSGDPQQAVTLYEGLKACRLGGLSCVKGADLVDDAVLADRLNVHGQTVFLDPRPAEAMIAEAVEAAKAADITIAVVGEAKEYSGESSSRTEIGLPAPQRRLVEALAVTGTKLVLVVMTGRPLALTREVAMADAVLVAWFAGTEAGNGLADVLTGAADPAGRLAMSFPARTGQIPVFAASEPTGRPYSGRFEKFKTGYLDLPDTVAPAEGLFPFGFGLSYTQFAYGAPHVADRAGIGPAARWTVAVAVENTGARAGTTVAQLYVRDPVARITRPLRELKGFRKLSLAPGERREIAFTLGLDDLAYLVGDSVAELERVVDPGTFILGTGPHAGSLQTVEITWQR